MYLLKIRRKEFPVEFHEISGGYVFDVANVAKGVYFLSQFIQNAD